MENFLFDTIKDLSESHIEFVICGGIACILHGCDRTTFDIDINLSMSDENIGKAIEFFKKNNYTTRIPEPIDDFRNKKKRREWIKEKNALVYTVIDQRGLIQIDIFLEYPIEFKELKRNSDIFDIDGIKLLVSSKEDLIRAKKLVEPMRQKDLDDIRMLEQLIAKE
jgi:hypothetical protein